MEVTLKNKCLDVLECKTETGYLRQLVDFANYLGYEFAAAMVVTDHGQTFTEFQTITNAPQAFLDDFHNLDKGKLDPVSQHCKRRSSSILWDADTYSNAGVRELWEYQSTHGYKTGVATAMHFHRGMHFMIGFSGSAHRKVQSYLATFLLDEFMSFPALLRRRHLIYAFRHSPNLTKNQHSLRGKLTRCVGRWTERRPQTLLP